MTVCIAAICEGGKSIVVAADRMFTVGAPVNVEFETSERKIERLLNSCVALSAGNSAYAYEILRNANIALAGRETAPMEDVVKLVNEAYIAARSAKVRETIMLPVLGPDFIRHESVGVSLTQYMTSQQGVYRKRLVCHAVALARGLLGSALRLRLADPGAGARLQGSTATTRARV